MSTGVSHFRFVLVQEGLNRYKAPALGFAAPAGRIMLRRSDLRVGLEIQIGNVHRRDRQFTFGTFIEPYKCKKKYRESGQSALSGPLRVVL